MTTPQESLRKLTLATAKTALATAKIDPDVGIAVQKVDDVETTEGLYERWVALIPSRGHGQPFVGAHRHFIGLEYYCGLQGRGLMHRGFKHGDSIVREPSQVIKPGDELVIEEGQIHCLENTGQAPFVLAYACPPPHMQEDREVVPQWPPEL